MNSRERVLCALDHREPDRVPITFDAEKEVIAALQTHFGVDQSDAVWEALHVDTRLIGVDHHYRHIRTSEKITYDFWGIGQAEQSYSGGTYMEYVEHPLAGMKTASEVKAYDWPTPDEMSFETLKKTREAHPDKAIIAHITHGGYFKATHLRGMEQFMMDLALEPDLAHSIIAGVTGYLFPAIERLCDEAGDTFDIFYLADDFCSSTGPMVSPKLFREQFKPYLKSIADIVHARDKKFLLHVCGSVRSLLPDLIEAGVDVLEPIQTSAAGMQVEGLKADFGDRMAFYGSIDLIHVLREGSPEDVSKEVLKNFQVLGKGGGFIVGPGHTYIQPDIPLQNILAMYNTAYQDCPYRS